MDKTVPLPNSPLVSHATALKIPRCWRPLHCGSLGSLRRSWPTSLLSSFVVTGGSVSRALVFCAPLAISCVQRTHFCRTKRCSSPKKCSIKGVAKDYVSEANETLDLGKRLVFSDLCIICIPHPTSLMPTTNNPCFVSRSLRIFDANLVKVLHCSGCSLGNGFWKYHCPR